MQAITTKFLPCTNSRGSRIKAKCAAGSLTISYPHELSADDAHAAAAQALIAKLGWAGPGYGNWFQGCDDKGNHVFVASGRAITPHAVPGPERLYQVA